MKRRDFRLVMPLALLEWPRDVYRRYSEHLRARAFSRIKKSILALIILLGIRGAIALAGISGSQHDFSGSGWGTTDICVFCHTPHNAKTPQLAPLWNHQSTMATYILYSSPTMDQTPVQPREGSKVCLSCHDGTIAVDSYGAQTGSHLMTEAAAIVRAAIAFTRRLTPACRSSAAIWSARPAMIRTTSTLRTRRCCGKR
jgi:hypothetical protein